jgi:hypothetical protein
MLNKTALDRSSWAKLIFSAGIERVRLWIKISSTQLAIPAHGEPVNTFDR